ncbi:N-alpha-acetyltransferase 40-like [Diadema antillarum]|uniref:N-alpha-acetyltransferase 40-like n=1 Tax=Diadema antillarum TaxID=105358 RepID=UPI003A84340D
MGRKSAKGKERKQKRKEEQAKFAAARVLVDAANQLDDPMESLAPPFKKYEQNGLSVSIESKKVTDLEKDVTDWIFNLTKTNMQSFYESSEWGWKEREKKEELMDEQARYLVARTVDDGKLVGFCHFRFDMDYEDEVIYCYEIQLTKDVRRKGLGKRLMQILELLAFRTQMKKVMITVFKNNTAAANFFTKVMKYEIDETSPSIYDPMSDEDYEIMSKEVTTKKSAPGPRTFKCRASPSSPCCVKCT